MVQRWELEPSGGVIYGRLRTMGPGPGPQAGPGCDLGMLGLFGPHFMHLAAVHARLVPKWVANQ